MLGKRLISSAVIISLLLLLVVFDFRLGRELSLGHSGLLLGPLLLVLVGLGCRELLDLFGNFKHQPSARVVIPASLVATALACVPIFWRDYPVDCHIGKTGWVLFGLAGAVGIIFVSEMFRYRNPGETIERISLGVVCVGYLVLLASFLVLLRLFHSNAWGMAALLTMVIVAKVSDTGAYTAGKLFGRHKFWPTLSPGKTWEGIVGGLLFGCVISVVLFNTLVPWLTGSEDRTPVVSAIAYGLIVTVAGMVGDLSESLLKRDAGIKDSSRWLPGLGGMLDIVDSLLVAAPAAYACWVVGLIGPG